MMRSAAKLSYAQTQGLNRPWTDEAMGPLHAAVLVPLLRGLRRAEIATRQARTARSRPSRTQRLPSTEKGAVKSISTPPRLDSHRLIEEFMILANVAAAEVLEANRQSFYLPRA